LFEWAAPPEPEDEQLSSDSGQGKLIDISVGDDELQTPEGQDTNFPGQVDPSLSTGLPGAEQQADIVRRMGWE